MKFENKISIDGVAVLAVAVTAAIWLGNLDAKVNVLGADSEANKRHVERLSDNQTTFAVSLASVAAQVNAIDHKEQTKPTKP
jgi:hypothetical protein